MRITEKDIQAAKGAAHFADTLSWGHEQPDGRLSLSMEGLIAQRRGCSFVVFEDDEQGNPVPGGDIRPETDHDAKRAFKVLRAWFAFLGFEDEETYQSTVESEGIMFLSRLERVTT